MNESALEGFVKIVELNSFSAAAEALYLSQSALSQQIRTLEGQLQFELFQHVPRRVALTPAGQDFYPKAKQLVALYQQAVRHARAVQQQENHRKGICRSLAVMRQCGCSCMMCFPSPVTCACNTRLFWGSAPTAVRSGAA